MGRAILRVRVARDMEDLMRSEDRDLPEMLDSIIP
jgi:hypothetical protein